MGSLFSARANRRRQASQLHEGIAVPLRTLWLTLPLTLQMGMSNHL
jgi:hypothetical protein